jgi:glc operon protein GlcG
MRMRPTLTSADVHKIVAAARAEAQKNKWNVTIAVVDDGGFLLHADRMDGAGPTSGEVAIGKAKTAALTRTPSKVWEDRVKERPVFVNYPAGQLIWGGLPIMHQGDCVGGVGVSGVASQDDEKIAAAGIAALGV